MNLIQSLIGSAMVAFAMASAQAAEPPGQPAQGCIATDIPNPKDLAVTLLKESFETWDIAVLKGYGDDTLNATIDVLPSTLENMWGGPGYFGAVFINGVDPTVSRVPDQPVAYGLIRLVDAEKAELNKHGSIMGRDKKEAKQNAIRKSPAAFDATLSEAKGKIKEALDLPNEKAICGKPVIIVPDVDLGLEVPPVDIPALSIPIEPDTPFTPLIVQPSLP